MNIKSNLNNFIAEDCDYFQRWDEAAKIFDNFYILGPENFKSPSNPVCLFQYPITFQRKNHEINSESPSNEEITGSQANSPSCRNMTNQELKSAIKEWEVIINTDGDKISQFIFPDGIQYIENDVNYLSTDFSLVDTFSKPPKIQDHIIFIKSDGSIPHYFFCLRFRSSPFSRPSAFSLLKTVLTSKKTNKGANKQEFNGFNQDEIEYYMSKMEDEFEKEMIYFKTLKKCPTCLFAFIFETQHPCHELYFNLIELITRLEASKRTVAANLHRILSSYSLPHRESGVIIVGNEEEKNDSDDFILIEKIENNSSQHHVDCIISIKDSRESIQSESSNSQDTNENEDKINLNKEDVTSDNESQIKVNKIDKNDSEDKINLNREDITSDNVNKIDKNDSEDQIKVDREDITSYSEDKINLDREDNINDNEDKINVNKTDKNDSGDQCKVNRIDKYVSFDCLWPANAFKARDDFLSSLYKSSKFPSVGEQITFKAGSSALSKFVWTRPTTMQSCVGLCVYGIEPLLEWITADDLVRILTLTSRPRS